MVWVLSLLKGFKPKRMLYLLGALVIAVSVWGAVDFIGDKVEADQHIIRLENTLADRDAAIAALELEAAQRASAELAANAARAEVETLEDAVVEIRRDIASATDEEDGDVADVLRRTLDALP